MLSSYATISAFEELPDEILLLICRYLSSTDVLYSFYGLNSRLSQTISGYYRHIVLAQVPFMRFKYICTSILPEIGSNISSLAVSNQWKGVLSQIFLSYFGTRMSLTFPHLQQLTLMSFSVNSLNLFLDCLQNLSELHKIVLCGLHKVANVPIKSDTLLHRIFSATNNRLNSISFNGESIDFSLENNTHGILYFKVKHLRIDLSTVNDLHRLLTLLPQLISVNVTIHKEPFVLDKRNENNPILTLKKIQLQSFGISWNLDELASVLKRIPNVEELSIAMKTYNDTRLIDGETFFSVLSASSSLRKFNYFVQFYDSSSSIDHQKILSTWQQFKREFVCITGDDKKTLVLYTLPFVFSYLILSTSLANNEVFTKSYAPQVKHLILSDVSTQIVDTFPIIKKCHRIHTLNLRINANIVPKFSTQIQLSKLSYLTKVRALRKSIINLVYFERLLEASPNLRHLEVNYAFLRLLLVNESECLLLRHRITHLYILISLPTSLESVISSISRLASIFTSLKHLYFSLEKSYQSCELLILSVLNYLPQWSSLVSFGVANAVMAQEILSKGVQEWVMENSTLCDHNSFYVDYTDMTFRLWF